MLSGMSSRQLSEWMAYAQIEPFGEERGDIRMAYALSILVNMLGSGEVQVTPADLMPRFGQHLEPAEDEPEEEEDGPALPPPLTEGDRLFAEMAAEMGWSE